MPDTPPATPAPPAGLGEAGKALWKAILAEVPEGFELDARELTFLAKAARVEDEIHEMEASLDEDGLVTRGSMGQPRANPILTELRQARLVQLRLLREIALDPEAEAAVGVRQACKAAEARWGRRTAVSKRRKAS
jgi:phage terminase small subunit